MNEIAAFFGNYPLLNMWCSSPGFTLRLCPRANKNLHMPSGYPPGNL
ncbi:hypothetical protein T05_7570 [Trichinella murrelli]|uniref:Uncharacterized protein n=1 Tax=Trichinella murrelli TaxID=144512 RepID=A0A0V0U1N3_9BILA|nr:hypothetical protein T05_7570 [Trichinella murrelli]